MIDDNKKPVNRLLFFISRTKPVNRLLFVISPPEIQQRVYTKNSATSLYQSGLGRQRSAAHLFRWIGTGSVCDPRIFIAQRSGKKAIRRPPIFEPHDGFQARRIGEKPHRARRCASVLRVMKGKWWACRDSNSRPLPCQGSALTN